MMSRPVETATLGDMWFLTLDGIDSSEDHLWGDGAPVDG